MYGVVILIYVSGDQFVDISAFRLVSIGPGVVEIWGIHPPGRGTICEIYEEWGSLDRNKSWYGLVILMEASGDQSVEVSTLCLVSMGPWIVEI